MVDVIRSSANSVRNNSPRLFTPITIRGITDEYSGQLNNNKTDGTFIFTTSAGEKNSFVYDIPDDGVKSTQQLKIDWSKFENHTFFESAAVKVNTAFEMVLNQYPFDGTQKQIEMFLDELTGYERWVFDNFPKYEGYLYFIQEPTSNTSTFVEVNDIAGTSFPFISKKIDGASLLNPGTNSFTVEFHLNIPNQEVGNMFVVDKHIGTTVADSEGWAITVMSSSTPEVDVVMHLFQNNKYFNITASIEKGDWNHISFVWNRENGSGSLTSYVNSELFTQSTTYFAFSEMLQNTQSMFIGSGSVIPGYFTPDLTLTGSLDELRIWKCARDLAAIKENSQKTIFAQDYLVACYRFDEATQVVGNESTLVIDSSGNSLHGRVSPGTITNGSRTLSTSSIGYSSPMVYSRLSFLPILFPQNPEVTTYYDERIESASYYDEKNPSLITKLVPKHYLIEGRQSEGYKTQEGEIINPPESTVEPGSVALGGTQTMLLLLYTMAKFFDEIKLFTKAFKDLGWVDYDEANTVPDALLKNYAKELGVEIPIFFQNSDLKQFIYGDNIDNNISINSISLQKIQNQLWRRLLTNLPDILKSRGTIFSLKQYIRSLGLEPDAILRIREYGGATKRALRNSREDKVETLFFLDFLNNQNAYVQNNAALYSFAERTEPGYPPIDNTSPYLDSTNSFLSGSWTYEGLYKVFPETIQSSQSLVRFEVGGTTTPGFDYNFITANVVAKDDGTLTLFYRDDANLFPPGSSTLTISIPANLYDGDFWSVSFGKRRWDDNLDSISQSLFFLRAAKRIGQEIVESYEDYVWYDDFQTSWQLLDNQLIPPVNTVIAPSLQLTGAYIVLGNKPITESSNPVFLNDETVDIEARTQEFHGLATEIRLYSEYIEPKEWNEHVLNVRSVGVDDPKTNWNFDFYQTGSWERLRQHYSLEQENQTSDNTGQITLIDYSQQENGLGDKFTLMGYDFEPESQVLIPQDIWFSQISPKFDSAATVEKIRVRGFNDESMIENDWEVFGPAYEIEPSEIPTDNNKLSIDFSITDALDKDIMTIFSELNEFDLALGSPENQFVDYYPNIEVIRKNYFNKLQSKLNIKGFFMFYKWFDTNFGSYLAQLLPYNAKFNGTNFVIESHMLERPKVRYFGDDMYHNQKDRDYLKANLTLQFITGRFRRY